MSGAAREVDAVRAMIGACAEPSLVPPVAQALRIWRRLGLELGETAIYTDGDGLGDVVGLVALWYGASPVVRLATGESSGEGDAVDGVETVTVSDAASAVARLRSLTADAPGAAAVDLSGNGSVLTVLLESLPRWGRLLLAGPPPDPFTTAFYTDIHRKGTIVCTAGELGSIFTDLPAWELEVRNACRLLADPARAAKLGACSRQALLAAVESGIGA